MPASQPTTTEAVAAPRLPNEEELQAVLDAGGALTNATVRVQWQLKSVAKYATDEHEHELPEVAATVAAPTFADVGSLWSWLRSARMDLEEAADHLDTFEGLLADLDDVRAMWPEQVA